MKLLIIVFILILGGIAFALCGIPRSPIAERPSVLILPVIQGGAPTQLLNRECADTRGTRHSRYRQVGTLSARMTSGDASNDVLPLFAAKSCMHRDRYFYHTQTGAYEPIKLPIHYKNRNCMKDDIGCETVYENDEVTVPILGGDRGYSVALYEDLY